MATPKTYDMVLTRTFDAPVEDVWRAWTEPELVKRWWGPTGFTTPLAEMDVREGGTSLVCMRAPAEFGGQDMYNTWTYATVIPMERLEFVQTFTDADRNPVEPADLGLPPGIPRDVPHGLTFGRNAPAEMGAPAEPPGSRDGATARVPRAGCAARRWG